MRDLIEAISKTGSDGSWARRGDSMVFKGPNDPILVIISPDTIIKTVQQRVSGDAGWREVWSNLTNDGEMFADGQDSSRFDRDFASWKKQGWYPKRVSAQGWRLDATHIGTKTSFEAQFETKQQAIDAANEAIPKLRERRRPSWLRIQESVETPEQMIVNVGPPHEWSGAVASVLGPERRKAITDFWASADAATKKRLQSAFERNFGESTLAGNVATTARPMGMLRRVWVKRGEPENRNRVQTEWVAEIGTVRQWKRGAVIKVAKGQWAPYGQPENPLRALGDAIASGAIAGSMKDRIEEANAEIDKHAKSFEAFKSSLKEIGGGAKLLARIKKVDSALGKLARKPKTYPDPSKLTDLTGAALIVAGGDEQARVVRAIEDKYEVVEKEDFSTTARPGGYRAIHFLVKDKDGLTKEVQVMTQRQSAWKDWCHDIYKPTSPRQARRIAAIASEVNTYGEALSRHLANLDAGKKSSPPECPKSVSSVVGCGPTA